MATTPPPAPGSAPPAKKKSNVVLWVIVGVFAFFLLIGMVIVGGMFFIWNKVQDVTNDMEGNPALAITKLITTINPDLEVVSVDEANNTIKIRQKSSNKTIELDLNEINQGNLSAVFEGDEGSETVDLKTDNTGSIEVKTKDKTLKIGSSGEIPCLGSQTVRRNPQVGRLHSERQGIQGCLHLCQRPISRRNSGIL